MKLLIFSLFLTISNFVFANAICPEVGLYNFKNSLNNSSSQGSSLNGTQSTAISYSTGYDGSASSAATFNGTSSRFLLPSEFDFPQRTWAIWVNAALIDNQYRIVIDADNPSLVNAQTQLFVNKVNNENRLTMSIGANSVFAVINANEWYHVAIVRDASEARFYLNGCLIGSGKDMKNNHAEHDGVENSIWVGCNREGSSTNAPNTMGHWFKGSIDDLRVYNCALTVEEIRSVCGRTCPTDISFDPCCPPMNPEMMKTLFKIVPEGTINAPYKIRFSTTPLFTSSSQAYCNYIKTLYPSVNRLTYEWRLYKAGNGNTPVVTWQGAELLGQVWNWFVPQGNGILQSTTNFFDAQLVVNEWYRVHVGMFTEPESNAFKGAECSGNTQFFVRIQVINARRKATFSDGKKIIAEMDIASPGKNN